MSKIFLLIGLLIFSQYPAKSQSADEKEIYLLAIKQHIEHIEEYRDFNMTQIILSDSISLVDAEKMASQMTKFYPRKDGGLSEWDSVRRKINFDAAPVPVSNYLIIEKIRFKKIMFQYLSEVPVQVHPYSYWLMQLEPLYFNSQKTKCFTISWLSSGKCATGADMNHFFQKDECGNWGTAPRLFKED